MKNPIPPIPVDTKLQLKLYPIVMDAIEGAIAAGVRRSFKHTETPSEDHITVTVSDYVASCITDLFDFGDSE